MPDDVTMPGIGAVPRRTVLMVGGGAAGIVVYLWYRRRAAATAAAAVPDPTAASALTDPYTGMIDTGTGGTITGYAAQGSDLGTTGPTTNAEWTAAVVSALSGAYDETAIYDALGRYLARAPLSDLDRRIVQAGIAAAGYPPVGGSYPTTGGGSATPTTAPTGLTVTSVTATSARLSWIAVPGASGYRVYRSDRSESVGGGTSTSWTLSGLAPSTSYGVTVAAVGANGMIGPVSASATVTTTKAPIGAGPAAPPPPPKLQRPTATARGESAAHR